MPAPYFLHSNILRAATVVSEATIANFGFANCIDGRTSTQMGLASGATRDVVIDFGSAKAMTHCAFAHHNLSGATLTMAGSADNSSYTTIATITPSNNYVQVHEFSSASYRYLRLRFSGHSTAIYISDLFVGIALELPYGMPFGFVPPELSDQDAIDANMTGNGALAGISVTTKPKKCKVSLQDYESSWFDSYWSAFASNAKLYPFYFLWAPSKRAMFCTVDGKIGDVAYSNHTRLSHTLNLEGFVE